ncbi:MAG: peptidase M24 [Deltaproteobacteria bacterium RIFOXYD12_FULL_57_12]|nr:MAG: peptidase M24 [Deltaproteobacteria bacterium RIFOXYD12_FULL_57_12]
MTDSLMRLQAVLQRKQQDALLVTNPENRYYLSGYSAHDTSPAESAGALLIPARGRPFLLTDFRFQLQAEAEAASFRVVLYRRGLLALLKRMLPGLGIKKLVFESHAMLYGTGRQLCEILQKLAIEPIPVTGLVEKLRIRKSAGELEKIRQAVLLNEAVFQEIYAELAPGQTERQVANKIEATMRAKGAEGPSFATIVASGPNGAQPHAVPGHRLIRPGEPVVIDMGVRLHGYCSDMTRTVVLGRPDDRTVELIRLVRRAQLTGLAAIRAGVTSRAVDKAAREVITRAGYAKYFGHGLGHGVGLAVHEAPALNRRCRKKLQVGMVVTVEPGIYLPGWGGVRLENMVIVTESGPEIINKDSTFLDI